LIMFGSQPICFFRPPILLTFPIIILSLVVFL
jgi:hypothetical protein